MMKRLMVPLEVWQWDGTVLTGGTAAEFNELLASLAYVAKEEDDGSIGKHTAGACYVDEGKPWLIWVEDPKDLETLVHEALHVVFRVLGSRGLTHSESSEEAYTYTLDAITRRVKGAKARDWKRVNA